MMRRLFLQDSGENQLWRPTNDTLKFYGPTRLGVGLAQSRNLVSIRLLQDITIPYAIHYVSRFGFDPSTLPNALSLALGSASVRPIRLAEGYAIFANGGYRVIPHFVQSITDENQNNVYTAHFGRACETCVDNTAAVAMKEGGDQAPAVITPQNAYIMTQALKGVIQNGTGRAAKVLGRNDIAGKTGTTNKQADAWFAGFNSKVDTIVWVGFDDLHSLHEYGSKAALPIWVNYMRQALKGMPSATMPMPPSIVTVRINPVDGLLARPDQSDSLFEVFRTRFAPTQLSQQQLKNPEQQQVGLASNQTVEDEGNTDDPLF